MKLLSLVLLITLLHANNGNELSDLIYDILGIKKDPDTDRNVTELISSKGYPAEDYTIQTKDGFLLGIQRIPSGRKKQYAPQNPKKVVLLLHGLLSSATDWVLNFPEESLGFILADAGYDVWLGNVRGNTYSRHHIKYSPSSKEFWDFSFDEMAAYDLPAMIDFVLNATGEKELSVVGHSQGTTLTFALLSQSPEYNKKIKLFIALAPVTTVGYITSAIRYLAPFTSDIDFLFKLLGVNEFLPSNALMKFLTETLCDTSLKFLCEDTIFLLCGTDYSQLNETRLGVYCAHTPAGASTKSIIHFAQMVNSKTFQKYDFGKHGNLAHYNQTTPPEYFVQNITTDVAIFWSKNDKLADEEDVTLLQGKLKSLVSSTLVNRDTWNHLDFVWGIDAHSAVYDGVRALLKKYSYFSH